MKRLNYSGITAALRRIHEATRRSRETGIPVDELLGQDAELRKKLRAKEIENRERRNFLKASGALGLGLGLGMKADLSHAATNPQNGTRVAIVGGGAGGVRTAHRLWTRYGWTSTIYEAHSNRVGGRIYSNPSSIQSTDPIFFEHHVSEWGGEFLSSEHSAIRNLADDFGLEEEDIPALSVGDQETYWINGQRYTEENLRDEWVGGLFRTFRQARKSAPWQPMYNTVHTPEHILYDNITAAEWLEDYAGYPEHHWIHKLLITDVISEYGMLGKKLSKDKNSALNLIYLLGFSNRASGGMPLAGTDERFRIKGGNDQIIHRMMEDMEEMPQVTVEYGHKLNMISGKRAGPYTLSFDGGMHDVVCDRLVMAMPLGLIHDNVEFDDRIWGGFSSQKRKAIRKAATADNGKLHMEFGNRFWATEGATIVNPNGSYTIDQAARAYSDPEFFSSTWEGDPGSSSTNGLMVDYTGGPEARSNIPFEPLTAPEDASLGRGVDADVTRVTGYFDHVWPDAIIPPDTSTYDLYTGEATVANWHLHPLAGGAFTSPTTGTMTVWWGAQWETEKHIYFAGEAYDEDAWSYMDGAIRSGKRVAREIHRSV